jgi:hypothetical protein
VLKNETLKREYRELKKTGRAGRVAENRARRATSKSMKRIASRRIVEQ